MTETKTIDVVPHGVVWALRRLKRDRQPEQVLFAMRRFFERWTSRQTDILHSATLNMEWEFDPIRRRPTAYFYWEYALLPAGYGKLVIPPGGWSQVRLPR